MAKSYFFITALSAMMFTVSAASAHPGAKILTTGSAEEQKAMTLGMSFEEVGSVHVFRGRNTMTDAAPAAVKTPTHTTIIKINTDNRAFRSFRRLRTQGFYSGTGPKSRRYTQGFYSGN
ncbi:MAG: hypothetical protein GXP04_00600 [Alphaproteobacteria bacterium]|nr:hypothetical protein [Alphaproteobacteria bacterium]